MLDELDEIGQIERLRQNRRHTHLQQCLRLDAYVRGDDDDGDLAEVPGLLKALQEIPAVHVRHGQVEQHDVRMMNGQRALSLGANAYITKPIQAPQVISKVKELLKLS